LGTWRFTEIQNGHNFDSIARGLFATAQRD